MRAAACPEMARKYPHPRRYVNRRGITFNTCIQINRIKKRDSFEIIKRRLILPGNG
jgi:hypothetical protein